MRRDNKEFKERFARWKNGEKVYEHGRPLPKYEDGKPNVFRRPDGSFFYSDGITETPIRPLNTTLEDPQYWTYQDEEGKIYSPSQIPTNETQLKQDNDLYTRQQIEKARNIRTWRSDVADIFHGIGEGAMFASNFMNPGGAIAVENMMTAAKGLSKPVINYGISKLIRPVKFTFDDIEPWMYDLIPKKYERLPYSVSWDDFIKTPKLGNYLDEGGEAMVYNSFDNPNYVTKIKSEFGGGRTLDDLEFMVNRDVHMNDLPGVEPIKYKGFTVTQNPQRILDRTTGKPKLILNERFAPIWEQKKLTPALNVNYDAFNVDPEMVMNEWEALHGYKWLSNGRLKYGPIEISDQALNNFGYDDFGNLKFFDPMIQNFKYGK